MERTRHEHVPALFAGTASVDPSRRPQLLPHEREFLIRGHADREVDDRLRRPRVSTTQRWLALCETRRDVGRRDKFHGAQRSWSVPLANR